MIFFLKKKHNTYPTLEYHVELKRISIQIQPESLPKFPPPRKKHIETVFLSLLNYSKGAAELGLN